MGLRNSEEKSAEKFKRRGSSTSATELRRGTAVFQQKNLITEEESDVESSIGENLAQMQKQKSKAKLDQYRRSQEVNDLNISLLKENQDVDVTKQIKKVNGKLKSPSQESKQDKTKSGRSSNDYADPQTSALDKALLGKVDQKPNLA